MITILANETIPGLNDYFYPTFKVKTFKPKHLKRDQLNEVRALICRSNDKLDEQFLRQSKLEILATVSSGSEHLPRDTAWQILDAKGCNAHAVSDYVLSTLASLSRNQLLNGNKIGIIGVGHVGSLVSARLSQLGFECLQHDPPRAYAEAKFHSLAREYLHQCDVITLHIPYTQALPFPSHHWLDKPFIQQLKPGCIIINTARGQVVDEQALLEAQQIIYCCDVYQNEPDINPKLIERATLCTPHIAGHTIEAKLNATRIISEKLHRYFGLSSNHNRVTRPYFRSRLNQTRLNDWQQLALTHYNPESETRQLKGALPAKLATEFTNLRKAHTMRHDMTYPWE